MLAHLLHREGIPFVVFERKTQADLCRLPKAGLIEDRTVRLLEHEGIAPLIRDFSVEIHRCEFRTPDESVVLDYAALTAGRPHYIYPQHQLVRRLCETLTPLAARSGSGMPSRRSAGIRWRGAVGARTRR